MPFPGAASTGFFRSLLGSFGLFVSLWSYVHFSAAHFDFADIDLTLGWAGDHSAGVHVELRSVPWTLNGATNERAV